MNNLRIPSDLRLQLELLSFIDPEYVSDLIFALIAEINNDPQDPDDMPYPVKKVFLYWIERDRINFLKENV